MNIKLVQWDITGNCNLNCRYCREKRTDNLPDLDIQEIKKIIDQFADVKVKMVAIAGGEPLLFRKLPEVLAYMKGKVSEIGITTNGTLISKRNIGLIKEYVDGVQISIDGSTPAIHDYYRGAGSFEKMMKGMNLLLENDVKVFPRFTIGQENKNDVESYVRLINSLGIKSAYLRRTIPCGNSKNSISLSASELYNIFKIAFEVGHSLNMHIGSADYFSQLYFDQKERNKAEKNLLERPNQILSGCSIGIEAFYLAQNGQILFCPYLPVYCGDMTKQHISDIWKESKMLDISRNLRWNKEGKCSTCKYLMCCGGCPAYIYLTTGKLTASDDGCWITT
jgi:radical SAM protein with 4Fe4S-binding SPASM domain